MGETGIIWLGMSRVVVRGALSGQTYPHSSPHVCGASLPRTLRETWRGSTKLAMVGGSCEDSFLGILDGLKRAMIGSSRPLWCLSACSHGRSDMVIKGGGKVSLAKKEESSDG